MIECKNRLELFEHFVKMSNKVYTYGTKKGRVYVCTNGVLYDSTVDVYELFYKRASNSIYDISSYMDEHMLGFIENNNIILSQTIGR